MCTPISVNCININSYGSICVNCGCCLDKNPNIKNRIKKQIEYCKEELKKAYNFDYYSEDKNITTYQKKKVKLKVIHLKDNIRVLTHLLNNL